VGLVIENCVEATVHVVAAGLVERLGVTKGDVLGILSPNSVEFKVLFLAAASLGIVTSAQNPLNMLVDVKKLFYSAGTKYIFTVLELLAKADATGLAVILIDGDMASSWRQRYT
jgi:acyl-coenzyme A synthetase/AMP-(fatty) acid ligase